MPVRLHVRGDWACFTRPEMKAERVSYDVMTPSAARGVLEAIYWKPQIRWVVDRIHVLKPIRFTAMRRNEVGTKIPAPSVKKAMRSGQGRLGMAVEEERQQRAATILVDVAYVVEAHFDELDEADGPEKHYAMFCRRARQGQCFHRPYLGCREFPADFALIEDGDAMPKPDDQLVGEKELGYMLLDIDHVNNRQPRFFRAALIDGVLDVPPPARRGGPRVILQALHEHYELLSGDAESGIVSPGCSSQKISFCVVLKPDGALHAFEPISAPDGKGKPRPASMSVPGQSKPSGSGINPCLLWDNATYLLGVKHPDHDQAWAEKRFEAFRDRHVNLQEQILDPHFTAVCRFLENWSPREVTDDEPLADPALTRNFGVFRIQGESEYVHNRPAVREYWQSQIAQASQGSLGQCLITGSSAPLARLHEPKIKGVTGSQSSGAVLVSFNLDAFTSYGKDQSYNAPVSQDAAFKYATALNHLLADRSHRVVLGDTTCVYWTGAPQRDREKLHADDLLRAVFDDSYLAALPRGQADQPHAGTLSKVKAFFDRVRAGKPDPRADKLENPDAPFYVLGLSPNASRLSVRFWLVSTASDLATRLARYTNDLNMIGTRPADITIRRLLLDTAREPKDIPPQLAGELTRAVLTGLDYPRALAVAVNRRIRADRHVTARRAAILKAWLIRNHRWEVPVSLDESRTDAPYLLGRLFAAYEKIQKDALGEKLNRTIKDSYLSAASATPAAVFPRLFKLSHHHLSKLKADKPGLAVTREKIVGQITAGLTDFPTHLTLQEQGLFAIGYYHQSQGFYTSKKDQAASDAADAMNAQETTDV